MGSLESIMDNNTPTTVPEPITVREQIQDSMWPTNYGCQNQYQQWDRMVKSLNIEFIKLVGSE